MFKSVIVLLLLGFVGLSHQQCRTPTIVNRAGWGARAGSSVALPVRPAPFVVIHHTVTPACNSDNDCRQQMRNMQNMHMNNNRWSDIGYNFCVGGTGIAYEGRGWGRQGAHAPGYNNQSVGICVIGTFTNALPSNHALSNTQALIACGVQLGHIRSAYWLIGHRQAIATECPGQRLFDTIRTWPRFNANPRPLY